MDQESGSALGRVTLAGAVALPGTRALDEVPTMSKLLRQPSDLAVNAYTPLGILVHLDPRTNNHRAVAFSVTRVLDGEEDLKLSEGDLVFVMTNPQAQSLAAAAAAQLQSAAQSANVPPSQVAMALSAAAAIRDRRRGTQVFSSLGQPLTAARSTGMSRSVLRAPCTCRSEPAGPVRGWPFPPTMA